MGKIVLFIALQVVDGILTAIAVNYFNIYIEINPLLLRAFELYGHVWSLIVVKSLTILFGSILYVLEQFWVINMVNCMMAIIVIYQLIQWFLILGAR